MFNRAKLKKAAKAILKPQLINTLPVTFTVGILYLLSVLPDIYETAADKNILNISMEFSYFSLLVRAIPFFICSITAVAESFFYIALVTNKQSVSFKTFINGFNLWLKGICAVLWSTLWTVLWMLLFIIPGIIKAIAYSQITFIIAENPNVSVFQALKISKTITKGFKGELFVLYISFIGWIIISYLTFGLCFFYALPYMRTTFSLTYQYLKNQALATGFITPEDFA